MTAPTSNPRRLLLLALVVIVSVPATIAALDGVPSHGQPMAPGFELATLQDPNQRVRLEDLRGRPVVLNFWATWCIPCRKEMPAIEAVHRALGDRVAFLGVDTRDTRRVAKAVVRSTGVRYPSGFDPSGRTARNYAVLGMPTTVFIASDGRVLRTHVGQLAEARLRGLVREAFRIEVPT